jgi:MFS family permease
LNTFGLLVLVKTFGLEVWQISLILFTSSLINMVGAPFLGRLLDRLGERTTLTVNYIVLTLCCIGFATINNVFVLIALILTIKLFLTLGMGLSTYVYRIAPPEELTPTLSAGISINHVTSVGMPILSGALLPLIGYNGIFWMTGAVLLLAIPFALMLQVSSKHALQAQPAPAR